MNNKYGYNYILFTLLCCTLFKMAVVYCNSYGCEDGWILKDTKCYFVSTGNDKENRDDSQKACDGMDSTLVTVASNETHDFIMGLREIDEAYWIGLKVYENTEDKSNWHWSDGTNNTLDKWSSDDNRDEACGFLNKAIESPEWRSSDCHNEEKNYICQTEFTPQGGCVGHHINNKCFIPGTDKLINTEAAKVCIDFHQGTLAAFADDDEWDDLWPKLGWEEYWIGLFALTWDDETTYDWHNWQEGDGPRTNKDRCVYINSGIDGEWQSNKCDGGNEKRQYICQKDAEIIQPTTAGTASPETSSTTSSPTTTTVSTTATTEFITHEVTSSITTERLSESSSTPTSSELSTTAYYISTTANSTDETLVTNMAMEIAFYIILTCDVLAAIAFVVLLVIYRRVKAQAEKNSIANNSTNTYYNIIEVTGQTKQEPVDSIDNHLYMADSSTIIHRKGAV